MNLVLPAATAAAPESSAKSLSRRFGEEPPSGLVFASSY